MMDGAHAAFDGTSLALHQANLPFDRLQFHHENFHLGST